MGSARTRIVISARYDTRCVLSLLTSWFGAEKGGISLGYTCIWRANSEKGAHDLDNVR